MRQRSARRKRQRVSQAIARGDEPPDPVSATLALTYAVMGAGAATGVTAMAGGFKKPPRAPQLLEQQPATVLAGEDTKLKPGQRTSGVMTGPQGLLSDAPVGRSSLLGS
jgi:hypothetical protein